ncbi:MAG: hypothetical protein Q9173_004032, partial [Seirophora scorigena]
MKFSPLPILLLSALGTTVRAIPSELFCLPTASSGTSEDCAKAMRKLPADITPANFHYGGTADVFQLPKTVREGSCEIKVETTSTYTPEIVSWLDIFTLTNTLMLNCAASDQWRVPAMRIPFNYKWYTGGTLTYGRPYGFRISIKKAPKSMGVEDGSAA